MGKKSSPEYWEKRIATNTWRTYNSLEEKNRLILQMYQDSAKSIADELYALGQKLGKDGVLSRSDMYKQSRLAELKRKTEKIIEQLTKETESVSRKNMQDGYKDIYKTAVDQVGMIDFALPNKKVMEEMLDRPWLGSNFSDRIWKNAEKLTEFLNDALVRGIEQGKTTTEMAIEAVNAMQSGFNVAHRLVRTETMHYLNNSSLQGYKDSGLNYVQYWAAEDERTCDECGSTGYHGRTFLIDKAPLLPLHPNCRCTYLPVVYEELTYEEEYAVTKYISPDAYVLNDKLRRKTELTPEEKQWIMNLDSALDKLPDYTGDITRSLYFYDNEIRDEFLKNYQVGNIIQENGYLSATKGDVYNPDGQVQISILNSRKGNDISMFNLSEQEILYHRNTDFTVIDVRQIDGVHHVTLTEV